MLSLVTWGKNNTLSQKYSAFLIPLSVQLSLASVIALTSFAETVFLGLPPWESFQQQKHRSQAEFGGTPPKMKRLPKMRKKNAWQFPVGKDLTPTPHTPVKNCPSIGQIVSGLLFSKLCNSSGLGGIVCKKKLAAAYLPNRLVLADFFWNLLKICLLLSMMNGAFPKFKGETVRPSISDPRNRPKCSGLSGIYQKYKAARALDLILFGAGFIFGQKIWLLDQKIQNLIWGFTPKARDDALNVHEIVFISKDLNGNNPFQSNFSSSSSGF